MFMVLSLTLTLTFLCASTHILLTMYSAPPAFSRWCHIIFSLIIIIIIIFTPTGFVLVRINNNNYYRGYKIF